MKQETVLNRSVHSSQCIATKNSNQAHNMDVDFQLYDLSSRKSTHNKEDVEIGTHDRAPDLAVKDNFENGYGHVHFGQLRLH